MPQLDPTWFASQLFWLFICFAALYLILSRIILPRIMGVMSERTQTVEGDISMAQTLKQQAEKAKEEYERTMSEARAHAQKLLDDAMIAHKERVEDTSKQLEIEIADKLRNAERKISDKKQELMKSLTPATTDLTASIVEKLTTQTPANDSVQAIIDRLSKENG